MLGALRKEYSAANCCILCNCHQRKILQTSLHIVSGTAPYLSELLHLYSPSCSLTLCSASDTWSFHGTRMGRRTHGERSFQYIGIRYCHLELSSLFCQACLFTLIFQVKTENPPFVFSILICLSFFSFSLNPSLVMHVFVGCVCVYVCVHVSVCIWGVCTCMQLCACMYSHLCIYGWGGGGVKSAVL